MGLSSIDVVVIDRILCLLFCVFSLVFEFWLSGDGVYAFSGLVAAIVCFGGPGWGCGAGVRVVCTGWLTWRGMTWPGGVGVGRLARCDVAWRIGRCWRVLRC